jgi:hypothetical protein
VGFNKTYHPWNERRLRDYQVPTYRPGTNVDREIITLQQVILAGSGAGRQSGQHVSCL